jgi:exosortase
MAAVLERNRLRGIFRSIAPYLFSFGALVLLVAPTLESVFSRWLKFDESYSHGFLLFAVSLFITAKKWKEQPPVAGFYPWWFLPFILALTAYMLGGILRVEALQELVLVPLILSVLAILVGWDQGRKFILPIGLLVFTMPVWDYISWPLQLMTVAANKIGLGLLGIDFRIDGVFVYLTGVGAFEVAGGCSGLRYLLVGQSLALLYGELNLRTVRSRIILFIAAVGLSLFANWLRVFVIIYMGYETNMQSSLIENHDNFGWWVFAATLIPLFLLGRKLEKTSVEQAADAAEPGFAQIPKTSGPRYIGPALVLVLSLAAFVALPSNRGDIREVPESYDLSLSGEKYAPVFSPGLEGWRPQIRNADRVFQQTLFERSSVEEAAEQMPKVFYASIHSYDFQRQGAEVVQYFNRNYDPDEWQVEDIFTLEGPGSRMLRGITLQQRNSGRYIHFAYGYYVEAIWESDPLQAKLAQLAGFFNARSDGSQITFGVSCGNCDGPEALKPFVQHNMPKLLNSIDAEYQ